jgi:AraC-like DNA-binding protein
MQLLYPSSWQRHDEFSITTQQYAKFTDGIIKAHWHSCYEIIYVTNGSRDFFASDKKYRLEEGDILVIPPYVMHGSDGTLCTNIAFGYAESVVYTPHNSSMGLKYILPFHGAQAKLLQGNSDTLQLLRTLIVKGESLFAGNSPARILEIRACILQVHGILWKLYMDPGRNDARNIQYLSEAQEFIEEHLAEDISPYDIADALHLSHSHLCRIIKNALHVTPAALINQFRLCLAERLLTEMMDLSITEVALRSGFHDSSYFIRVFHANKGMTPKQFQQLLIQARSIS